MITASYCVSAMWHGPCFILVDKTASDFASSKEEYKNGIEGDIRKGALSGNIC